ncbi:MAG: hypothetical protein O7D95_06130 [Betaproteobacteria bacterium]|nr:hypothetical protein [Betaproteobacteria bacterium]
MGWLSFLTGNSETAEKVVDGVIGGIDAMFFTDEEKSQANFKILGWKLEYAKATQGMSISRRIITFAVVFVWVVLVLLLVVIGLWFGGENSAVKFLFTVMTDVVMQPFSIIVGFYFLAHVVGNARK